MNQNKSNFVWVVSAVVVLGLLAWWYWVYQAPGSDLLSDGDKTADIASDFQTVSIDGAIDQEMDALDKDINQL